MEEEEFVEEELPKLEIVKKFADNFVNLKYFFQNRKLLLKLQILLHLSFGMKIIH